MKFLLSCILLLQSILCIGQAVMLDTAKSNYIQLNDVKIHYKVWGKGEPIILLHGAMEYWKEWKNQIPELSKKYQVFAIDTRGHGSSSFADKPLDYKLLAEDVNNVLEQLKLASVYVVGYGDGGIIGINLALSHPEKVNRLIAIGSNLRPDSTAVYPDVLEKVKQWDIDKMAFYLQMKFKENPNPKMMNLFAKRMQTLLLTEPHLTNADLAQIKCPVLFMQGDHDIIKLSHLTQMFENTPNAYMSVIQGSTHYCIKEKPSVVNAAIIDFIKFKPEPLKRF